MPLACCLGAALVAADDALPSPLDSLRTAISVGLTLWSRIAANLAVLASSSYAGGAPPDWVGWRRWFEASEEVESVKLFAESLREDAGAGVAAGARGSGETEGECGYGLGRAPPVG